MSYDDISWACRNGPVIVLNADSRHSDALILRRPKAGPIHIPLPEVTLENLEQQRSTLLNVLQHSNVRTQEMESSRLFEKQEDFSSKSTAEHFEEILNWLWKSVVSPLLQALESFQDEYAEGRIWWCLTGAFVGLPVHAASKSDKFIHSYTSTLVGVTHNSKAREGMLPGVEQEVKGLTSTVGKSNVRSLVGSQATVDAVKNMQLSNAEFVYLAACETAMGDSELVNESFHLGGGFITAGFKGDIGTLWSMRDLDGPGVADAVHTHLFRDGQPKASEAARALHIAVRKLRSAGVPHKRWVPFIRMGI
ncbi:hypothetical protein B0H14DRAFT_2622506 [Mycena olivaceomarginata]|nr:hypothetical protein B0H14DRAFT_2622506 [Mycena olivaceomarginata]